jgi:hypothetical protein
MFLVIKKPLITKKTSTPTNPPGKPIPAWNKITPRTAMALSPSTSPLYVFCIEITPTPDFLIDFMPLYQWRYNSLTLLIRCTKWVASS